MIKNDRQYRITKARAGEFEEALRLASGADAGSDRSLFHRVQREAIEGQLSDLREELDQYDLLKDGKITSLEIASLAQLPETLIKGRIMRGWTQKDLADKLGLKEQQIQRYESDEYATASLEKISQVAGVLGLELDKAILRTATHSSFDRLLSRVEGLGLDRDFVEARLIPRTLKASIDRWGHRGKVPEILVAQVASVVSKIFGLSLDALTSESPIAPESWALAGVRFKLPKTTAEKEVAAYSVYAHYIALLVLECTPKLRKSPAPNDPIALRRDIVRIQGSFSLESVLRYVWGLGIAVVPLRDKGQFHAAYFRVNDRHVIVLKQRTSSLARWIIDVLHELRHALSNPGEKNLSVIDSEAQGNDFDEHLEEEEEATEFAGECALEGKAEELVHIAHKRSRQNLRFLKSAVVDVAREHNVDLALFANYVAYRLTLQGINWWGVATNLQPADNEPWNVTRRIFLEQSDMSKLNEFDRELLLQALKDE